MQPLIDMGLAACDAIEQEIVKGIKPRTKRDGSTVTNADLASEQVILQHLRGLTPHMPVVSEEAHDRGESDAWQHTAWLVDPLDSTSSFVRGSPDYAVIVGLVSHGVPMWGMVAVPATRCIYVGDVKSRITIKYENGEINPITCRPPPDSEWIVTHSPQERTPQLHVPHVYRTWARNSALKFGLVAEGAADVYVRASTLNLWDVAGGHALVQAAGGSCVGVNQDPITYTSNNLHVPPFIVTGWQSDQ